MDGIRDLRDEHGLLAYAVLGSGPPLVFVSDLFFPIESMDEEPLFARLLDGLASFATVIVFDKRGIGYSDPIDDWDRPIFDTWAHDVVRIIDAVGGGRATVFGAALLGGLTSIRLAATVPDRVDHLVLMNAQAGTPPTEETRDDVLRNVDGDSDTDYFQDFNPSRIGDDAYERWTERAGRRGASPADARSMWTAIFGADFEGDLESISVPTTILIRPGMRFRPVLDACRETAAAMSGATVVELSGEDWYPHCGDVEEVVSAVASVMGGERVVAAGGLSLLTVLFTDIVRSTERAREVGDTRWRGILDIHDEIVRKVVGRHGGSVVKHTGDGVLATFTMPSRGLRAAAALREELARARLDVRIGLNTAEVERRGDDVAGAGVNLAARVMDCAGGGEILVSAAVPVLVAGSEFAFSSRGRRTLKGLDGEHELFALESPS